MKKIDALRETIKKYLGSEMDAKAFTDVETALALFEKFAPDKDAGQAFLLLHNYSLVGEVNDPPQTALLQKAHVCLRGCSSKQKWQQLLEQYRAVRPSNICFYRLTEEKEDDKKILKLSRNPNSDIASERTDIYFEYVTQYSEKQYVGYAHEGSYQFWLEENCPPAEVTLPRYDIPLPKFPEPKTERPQINVSIESLLSSAKEMSEILPGDYCFDAMKKNTLKCVNNGHVRAADIIELKDIVNTVGMVGSGKSTLMKVLSYQLAKQGKKTVIVLDTVADTLQMYAYFRQLGLSASPLLGRSEREKYIYQVAQEGSKYLRPEFSEYLTATCIISGMSQGTEAALRFGKEPCTSLKRGRKRLTNFSCLQRILRRLWKAAPRIAAVICERLPNHLIWRTTITRFMRRSATVRWKCR